MNAQNIVDFNSIDVKGITAFAVQVRYPDNSIIPTEEETLEYLQIATEIKELILTKII
jgi:hypothetical protein